jgi:serine/threonine-protein kinase
VDDRGLLFRIELNDYGWTEATWGALADAYPYAVQYDEDSQLFPYDETSNAKIREETGEPIPYVQADWFISNCSRPPLYNQLLGLPSTLNGLADKLGVKIQDDITSGQAVRAGLRQAGSSQYDRVVERHKLPGSAGALWISYGFNSGVGKSDVFAHPLDFEPQGIQAMFALKNGLSGYMVFDAQGQAIDKAPNDIEQDPHARDGAAETGISCLSCHSKGPVAVKDEVRDSLTSSAVDASVLAGVKRLYAPQETLDGFFKDDIQRFTDARAKSLSPLVQDQTIHDIDDRHLDVLTLSEVAGVLGMPATELDRGINAAPLAVPDSIRTLRKDGAFVRRDAFEADFADLVTALSLGKPYSREDLLNGNSDSSDSSNSGSGSDSSSSNGSTTSDGSTTTDTSDPTAPSDGTSSSSDSSTGSGSSRPSYP